MNSVQTGWKKPPKKDQTSKITEAFGTALAALVLGFCLLVMVSPLVWTLRIVYSWALGL